MVTSIFSILINWLLLYGLLALGFLVYGKPLHGWRPEIAAALVRLLRKEPVQPALFGALGVAIAAYIAWQTGEAKDYFLLGIWMSLILALVFLASMLVRGPLVGVIWNSLNGAGHTWLYHATPGTGVHRLDLASPAGLNALDREFAANRPGDKRILLLAVPMPR